MEIIGITVNDKIVVKNIAKLYFQTGLPLDIIFDILDKNNYIPSWIDLTKELMLNGIKKERVFHILSENICNTYGKVYRNEVLNILQIVFTSII